MFSRWKGKFGDLLVMLVFLLWAGSFGAYESDRLEYLFLNIVGVALVFQYFL